MFADPQNNIKQFGLGEGSVVADLGAGAGFYTIAAAKAAGPTGKVYSIDFDKDLLAKIKDQADRENFKNIEVIQGDLEKEGGTKLADSSMDAVIASNILFQIRNKDSLVKEIRRILKTGGKVLVVDWKDSFSGMGPAQKSILSEDMAKNFFLVHDFTIIKEIAAGEHHYGIIFTKHG